MATLQCGVILNNSGKQKIFKIRINIKNKNKELKGFLVTFLQTFVR